MNTTKKQARIAGFWYLMMAITGPIGMMMIRARLIESGNAAATAKNILESESLFRIGIVTDFLCQLAFIWLVLALYQLFKEVNKVYARLMVSLVLVSIPIALLNLLNPMAALLVLKDTDFLTTFSLEQRQSLAMMFLNFQDSGLMIAEVFWGLWLFPFGWLTYKSGFLPQILGVLLILAGASYTIDSTIHFLFPGSTETLDALLSLPEAVGELSMVVWLVIKGAREQDTITRKPVLAMG